MPTVLVPPFLGVGIDSDSPLHPWVVGLIPVVRW